MDAGLRMDGIPALDRWDLVTDVLHSSPSYRHGGNLIQCVHSVRSIPKIWTKLKPPTLEQRYLRKINHVDPNTILSHHDALLYIVEDSEAEINIDIKERSPTMRHVSRTHRMDLDW